MTERVLVSLGRLPKGLELARALHAAGARVTIAESMPWNLSRISRAVAAQIVVPPPATRTEQFRNGFLDAVARTGSQVVAPVSEEIFHVAAACAELPEGVRFHGMPLASLLALHDKLRFAELAERLGLPVPVTHAASTDAAARFAASNDFITKPWLSSSGHGVGLHRAGDALPPERDGLLVQQRLEGAEFSTFSATHAGRVIGTVAYRARILSGTVAVCFERIEAPDARALSWIERLVDGTDFTGFISFDFREDAGGTPWVLECNPRATSGIHFVEHADLAGAVLDPAGQRAFRTRKERVLQQFFPALTATQSAAWRGLPWRQNLKLLFGCRDVAWSPRDPLPFLLMTPLSWPILKRVIFEGMSFGEASTVDVGWYDAAVEAPGGDDD